VVAAPLQASAQLAGVVATLGKMAVKGCTANVTVVSHPLLSVMVTE
jgi:hypothetical protein